MTDKQPESTRGLLVSPAFWFGGVLCIALWSTFVLVVLQ